MYISLMFDTCTSHHKCLKGSCYSIQEVPSYINRVGAFLQVPSYINRVGAFLQVAELSLSSYLSLR